MNAVEQINFMVKFASMPKIAANVYNTYTKMTPEQRQQVYDQIKALYPHGFPSGEGDKIDSYRHFVTLHEGEMGRTARARASAGMRQQERAREAAMERARADQAARAKDGQRRQEESRRHAAALERAKRMEAMEAASAAKVAPTQRRPSSQGEYDRILSDVARRTGNSYIQGGRIAYPSLGAYKVKRN